MCIKYLAPLAAFVGFRTVYEIHGCFAFAIVPIPAKSKNVRSVLLHDMDFGKFRRVLSQNNLHVGVGFNNLRRIVPRLCIILSTRYEKNSNSICCIVAVVLIYCVDNNDDKQLMRLHMYSSRINAIAYTCP